MGVTKSNGFVAPYRSETFQNIANDLAQRNGVLFLDGEVYESGGKVYIPPITFIQNGLLVTKDTETEVTLPSMSAPYFVTVSAATSANTDDLVWQFAKSPEDITSSQVIIAENDGTEWRDADRISLAELVEFRRNENIREDLVGPEYPGLITSINGGNYETLGGSLIDTVGDRVVLDETYITPVIAADPEGTWSRVDRMIYRRPMDNDNRIGRRLLEVGSTYSAGSQTLHDTQLEAGSLVNQNVKVLVASDNTVHFLVAQGYGTSFNIRHSKYSSDRSTQLVAPHTIASSYTAKFDAVMDSSDNIHLAYITGGSQDLTWELFNDSGVSVDGPDVIESEGNPCDNPKITLDPAESKVFFVYELLANPGINEIHFVTTDLTGSIITAYKTLISSTSNLINPSMVVTDDLRVYVAYEDNTQGKIFYQYFDDIGDNGSTAVEVSDDTDAGSHGTLADGAKQPTIMVADNKEIFVTFLQDKGASVFGLAVWKAGVATLDDFVTTGENFTHYSAKIDSWMNGIHLVLIQSTRVDYGKLEAPTVVFTTQLSASGGAFGDIAKDNLGSNVVIWSAALSTLFSDIGAPQTINHIGPIVVTGTLNNMSLDSDEFAMATPVGYTPSVGDRVTVSGSGAGNDGAKIVTEVTLFSKDAAGDFYVVKVDSAFASVESPAAGVTGQFAQPNGNEYRFIKCTGEVDQATALRQDTLDSDVLLARISGSTILNYIPTGGMAVDSDIFAVYGTGVSIDWESTTAGELTLGSGMKILDLINNDTYTVGSGGFAMSEADALYIVLNGTDLTPTPQVTPVSLLPWGSPIQVLGFIKDGEFHPHLLSVADVGRLESGELVVIGQDLPTAIRTRIGITGDTTFEAYTSTSVLGASDTYPAGMSKLDTAAGTYANQDRNTKLIGGGTWLWTLSSTALSFTADAYIQVPGLNNVRNRILQSAESPITLSADGQVAYVDINRDSGVADDLTVNMAAINSLTYNQNRVIIARRVGNTVIVGHSFMLKDGERLELDGALSEIERLFGQLKLKPHESNADQARVTGADISLLDGAVLSQEMSNLFMSFDGAVIDFTTGTITKSDGATPLGQNFTPFAVPASEYFWYGIAVIPSGVTTDNLIEAQVLVTLASAADTVQADAPKPPIAGTKKIGGVQVYNNGGTIELAAIRRFGQGAGGGGTGTGDATDIQSRIDDIHDESYYDLAQSSVFSKAGEDYIDAVESTGTYSVADNVYELENPGEKLVSANLIDYDEFSEEKDIGQAIGLLFQDLDNLDAAIAFEVSRDGPTGHFQSSALIRVGLTDLFRMDHDFTTEKDEDTEEFTTTTAALELEDVGNDEAYAQEFTTSEVGDLTEVSLTLSRLGTLTSCNANLKVVHDDGAGKPSLSPNGLIAETGWFDLAAYSTSPTAKVLAISNTELGAGTFHIVLVTDGTYKTTFSTGVNALRVHGETGSPTPEANVFNGLVWAASSGNKLAYSRKMMFEHFSNLIEYSITNADATLALDASTNQQRAQGFTLTDDLSVIKRLNLYFNKIEASPGDLEGNMVVHLVSDGGGLPGSEILGSSGQISIEDLAAGNIEVPITIFRARRNVLTHIVITTDQTYKNSYVAATTELRVRVDSSSPPAPVSSTYNGTVWSSVANNKFCYRIDGRKVDLRVRITADSQATLTAFAALFEKQTGTVATSERLFQEFNFSASSGVPTLTELEVTDFNIDTNLPVIIQDVDTGACWGLGGTQGFSIRGNTLVPPSNMTYVDRAYEWHVWQPAGGGIDNSHLNERILAESHLGPHAKSGRGIVLKDDFGQLIEAAPVRNGSGGYDWLISHINSPPEAMALIGPMTRNVLINGAVDYAQRYPNGSGAQGLATVYQYTVHDRWATARESASWTGNGEEQSTENPGLEANYSMKFTGQPDAVDCAFVARQRIEARNSRKLVGALFSTGMMVRSDNFETVELQLAYANSEDDFSTVTVIGTYEEPLTADGTWQRIKFNGKSLLVGVQNGLQVRIRFKDPATTGVSSYVNLTEVIAHSGAVANPFQRAGYDIANELQLCQRYYEKSYEMDQAPGSTVSGGTPVFISPQAGTMKIVLFQTRKRVGATMIFYNPGTGASNEARDFVGGGAVAKTSITTAEVGGGWTSISGGPTVYYHWTADAEL